MSETEQHIVIPAGYSCFIFPSSETATRAVIEMIDNDELEQEAEDG